MVVIDLVHRESVRIYFFHVVRFIIAERAMAQFQI